MTLCPLDGRYGKIKDQLADYFSEYALVKYRVFVEIQWLKFQLDHLHTETLDKVDPNKVDDILAISKDFNFDSFKRIKEIESVTRHDVKAVEYFIDEKLKALGYEHLESYVHIGCTSEDINNLSHALMLQTARQDVVLPYWRKVIDAVKDLSVQYRDIPLNHDDKIIGISTCAEAGTNERVVLFVRLDK